MTPRRVSLFAVAVRSKVDSDSPVLWWTGSEWSEFSAQALLFGHSVAAASTRQKLPGLRVKVKKQRYGRLWRTMQPFVVAMAGCERDDIEPKIADGSLDVRVRWASSAKP